jgi:hypothetical protein
LITRIIIKDWKLLWPLVLLATAFQVLLGWLSFGSSFFGEDLAAQALYPPLSIAWYLGVIAVVVAVVHQDAIPGVNQDWLIRPLKRSDLLLAKTLFIIASISLPMLVVDLLNAVGAGFTLSQALGPAAVKEVYVFLTLVVPLFALASVTENWPQIVIGSAILIVLFAVSLIAASFAIGTERCPTCGTGLRWIQSLLEHGAVLGGAILILCLQYFYRQTAWSRWLITAGLILFVFVQLPWSMAFAIQRHFSSAPGDAAPIEIAFDPTADKPNLPTGHRAAVVGAAGAAHALLRGNSDEAAEYLRRRTLHDNALVSIDLPLRITGVPGAALLQVDRSEVRLLDDNGRVLYRSANGGELAGLTVATGERTSHQMAYLPTALYQRWAQRPLRIEITYSFALLKVSGKYSLPATTGELRAAELGRCETKLSRDSANIRFRCKQVGLGPLCYTLAVEAPNGQRNPETQGCAPNYRPFAALWSEPLTHFGIDVPVRDDSGLVQYPVAAALLPESRLLITTYSARDHFMRTLVTPPLLLTQHRAQLQ